MSDPAPMPDLSQVDESLCKLAMDFAERGDLLGSARTDVAGRLAAQIRPLVGESPSYPNDDEFLEAVAAAVRHSARVQPSTRPALKGYFGSGKHYWALSIAAAVTVLFLWRDPTPSGTLLGVILNIAIVSTVVYIPVAVGLVLSDKLRHLFLR